MIQMWMQLGNCHRHDPDVFFPSDGVGVIRAQQICATCPVQAECLDHTLTNHIEHGVWGGASERQRQRMRRSNAGAASGRAS